MISHFGCETGQARLHDIEVQNFGRILTSVKKKTYAAIGATTMGIGGDASLPTFHPVDRPTRATGSLSCAVPSYAIIGPSTFEMCLHHCMLPVTFTSHCHRISNM